MSLRRLMMNFMRRFYLFRRRKKQQPIFLCFVMCLIISSSIFYWWMGFDSHEEFFQNPIKRFEYEDPIIFKYVNQPFNIHVDKIIDEAKRKYYDQNEKYLVYSCRFMCGGKIEERITI